MNPFIPSETHFHFMVDLETLALTHDAAVTEIGAVAFTQPGWVLHRHVHSANGVVDTNTELWRLQNNLHWKTHAEGAIELYEALGDLESWIRGGTQGGKLIPVLWCKGTDFDATILKYWYRFLQIPMPWKYNNIRDMRTLINTWPQFQTPKDKVKHSALEDAKDQVENLRQLFTFLNDRGTFSWAES